MTTACSRPHQARPGFLEAARCVRRRLLLAALVFGAEPSGAAELTFQGSFATTGLVPAFLGHFFDPDGVAHDPVTGNLFLIDSFEPRVVQVTPSGAFVSTFAPLVPGSAEGIDVLPSGNLAVCEETMTTLSHYTQAGGFVGSISLLAGAPSPTGVAFDPTTGHYFVSDDEGGAPSIRRVDATGALLASIPTPPFGTFEPEGVDFDPASGHLFFVSDDTAGLYRITTAGALVDSWNLATIGGLQDPEGVAYDGSTATVWVASDGDAQVGRFTVPEPAGPTLATAAAASLLFLSAASSPRRGRARPRA